MNKSGQKTRDIKFYSKKNDAMIIVHSREARAYTKHLEDWADVRSYVAGKPIDSTRLQLISTVDIRGDYFKQCWESDFYLLLTDGTVAVRELITTSDLTKRAEVEKLELSRRYWRSVGVTNWKIICVGGNQDVY